MAIKNKIFFFLIFLLLTTNITNPQGIKEVTGFGDSLFQLNENYAALNEYQRAFFFSSNYDDKAELSKKIADCYISVNELGLAYDYYDTALYYSAHDSTEIEYQLGKILCLILEKDFGYALLKLDELEVGTNEYFSARKNLFTGICNFGLEKYDEAYNYFYKSLNPNDSLLNAKLDQLFDGRKTLMRPYPAVATTMSVFIPGSGQAYAGDFKDGINSLLLLGTLAYIALYTPVLNFWVIFPFFYRYYIGGILNANNLAKERKKEKQYDCYVGLMKILKENGYLKTLFNLNTKQGHYNAYLKNSVSGADVLLSFSFLFYKKYISSQDVDACVFHPTCSAYMIGSINKNGFFIGFLNGFDRLLRCHSFVNEHDYPCNLVTKKCYDPF